MLRHELLIGANVYVPINLRRLLSHRAGACVHGRVLVFLRDVLVVDERGAIDLLEPLDLSEPLLDGGEVLEV